MRDREAERKQFTGDKSETFATGNPIKKILFSAYISFCHRKRRGGWKRFRAVSNCGELTFAHASDSPEVSTRFQAPPITARRMLKYDKAPRVPRFHICRGLCSATVFSTCNAVSPWARSLRLRNRKSVLVVYDPRAESDKKQTRARAERAAGALYGNEAKCVVQIKRRLFN